MCAYTYIYIYKTYLYLSIIYVYIYIHIYIYTPRSIQHCLHAYTTVVATITLMVLMVTMKNSNDTVAVVITAKKEYQSQ